MLRSLMPLLLALLPPSGDEKPAKPRMPARALPSGVPTVFRRIGSHAEFPELRVANAAGEEQVLTFASKTPTVIAFLRPDQNDSKRVLSDLSELALAGGAPGARLIVIGLKGRHQGGWPALQRGWPSGLELFFDEYGASKLVGLVAVPSVAVLNREGRLENALILHEPTFLSHLRRNLTDVAAGRAALPDEAERLRARFEQMSANAAGLEAAGDLNAAIELRRQQLELDLNPAAVHAALGRLCLRDGRADAAVEHFRQSLGYEDNYPVRVGLSQALILTGSLVEAQQILSALLDSNPDRATVHRALAEIAHRRGNIDEALGQIKKALAALHTRPLGGLLEEN